MFTVITGAEVYAPQPLGVVDILIVGERVAAIGKDLARGLGAIGAAAEVIDLSGRILTPGLIDGHYHPLGGGDYEGPLARTTDIELGELIRNGITTGVGVLGSDCDARNLPDLVMKGRELAMGGFTFFFYTGSFFLPPVTLTGAVRRDIMVVESCIGVKFAISEEMAFNDEIDMAKVAVEGVHGGSLAGKPGIVQGFFHDPHLAYIT